MSDNIAKLGIYCAVKPPKARNRRIKEEIDKTMKYSLAKKVADTLLEKIPYERKTENDPQEGEIWSFEANIVILTTEQYNELADKAWRYDELA